MVEGVSGMNTPRVEEGNYNAAEQRTGDTTTCAE